MRTRSPAVLSLIVCACLAMASPPAQAQSLWSQNKPEQAAAAKVVIEDATVAMRVARDMAVAKGNAAEVAKWDKAIAAATHGANLAAGIESGDVSAQDAAASGLLTTLGPWGLLATPFVLWGLREWRAAAALKVVKKAEADATAAAKSIVNMVDTLRIADPAIAESMKKLSSDANTDFTKNLTPLAKEIIAAERLT